LSVNVASAKRADRCTGGQIVGEAVRSTRVGSLQFGDQLAQPLFGIRRVGGFIESGTVRPPLISSCRPGAARQFGNDIAQLVDSAPATVSLRPSLIERLGVHGG
jgi:hypothetical protein